MKKQNLFPGILLIGIGLYFLLDGLESTLFQQIASWPSILMVIGIAFLAQGYGGKDGQKVFPGILLIGLGVHFHGLELIEDWPDHWGMYTLILSIAFLASHQRTKKGGLVPGLVLFILSALALFYEDFISWLGWVGRSVDLIEQYWPIALIIIGLYILFFKKK